MRVMMFAVLLLFAAAPAFACGWQSTTAAADQASQSTVASDSAQSQAPASKQHGG